MLLDESEFELAIELSPIVASELHELLILHGLHVGVYIRKFLHLGL